MPIKLLRLYFTIPELELNKQWSPIGDEEHLIRLARVAACHQLKRQAGNFESVKRLVNYRVFNLALFLAAHYATSKITMMKNSNQTIILRPKI